MRHSSIKQNPTSFLAEPVGFLCQVPQGKMRMSLKRTRSSSSSKSSSCDLDESSPAVEHFSLPKPVVQVIGKSEELLSSHLVVQYWPVFVKFLEWNFFYLLCHFGFGYGWILFLLSVYYMTTQTTEFGTEVTRMCSVQKKEKEVLSETLSAFPAWVAFPDFDRVEWINQILGQLWSNVDCYATLFVRTFIEPKLHHILDLMQLSQVSGFQVKQVDLGTIPARINGIKVYDRKRVTTSNNDEIILDCDVAYDGDARVVFTLQGISAQIYNIRFRGLARIHLKPLLTRFPFVGGFEFFFITAPKLEYSLGGIGSFGDVPGISGLVRSIVLDKIRSRFVWPNKFKLYFPLPEAKTNQKWTYMLPKPSGLLNVHLKEGRNLLKKDKHFGGSGKSDPYAVISIGERKVSFRSKYIAKTVDPVWNYTTSFLMEDPNGQNLKIEVFDFDAGSTDDFLGVTSIPLSSVLDNSMDRWVTLNDVKHGDVYLKCNWKEAKPAEDETNLKAAIVSVFVDKCSNLTGGKSSSVYPKCRISLNGRQDDDFTTLPRNKTENPLFEQGWMLTSTQPQEDEITIEVIDVKGVDTLLGKVQMPLKFLLDLPQREFFDMEMSLEGGHPSAKVSLSAKLYSVV